MSEVVASRTNAIVMFAPGSGGILGLLILLLIGGCHRAAVAVPDAGAAGPVAVAPGQGGARAGGDSVGGGGPGGGLVLPAPDATMAMAEDAACAAESVRAERAGVDLLFLVDVSSSMAKIVPGGTRSKLKMAEDALVGFMRAPGSMDLAGALQFFPVRAKCVSGICVGPVNPPGPTPPCPCPAGLTCMPTGAGRCSGSGAACPVLGAACAAGGNDVCAPIPLPCPGNPPSCELADYRSPRLGFAPMATLATPTALAFAAQDPLGGASGTPTGPAIQGGLDLMRAHLAASPGRRGALVVISDGAPTLCEPLSPEAIATPIATARQMIPGIPTFFIGVFGADDRLRGTGVVVDRLAQAGGTSAFVLDPAQDITPRLLQAFDQIRTLAVPCDFTLPMPAAGVLDYGRVNVNVGAMGAEANVPYVGDASRCSAAQGGWHYDVDPAGATRPSRVVLCPATCRGLQDDATAKVDLRFGCRTRIIE